MKQLGTDQEIMDGIVAEFEHLAKIPRKSGHEQKISDFLCNYAKELGFEAKQDAALNVIIEKPAQPGYENSPCILLQAHMDMVCVAEDGTVYDSERDAIRLVRNGQFLSADRTSLGGDDGMGIATILFLLRKDITPGPLRAIFTTDEEVGMKGAIALDAQVLQGAYLLNLDSENYDKMTISSAGSLNVDFSRAPGWKKPTLPQAYRISVKGLTGGHSGVEIHMGRANAIHMLAMLIEKIREKSPMELADLRGGSARNAIPANASAILVLPSEESARAAIAEMEAFVRSRYGKIEAKCTFLCERIDLPEEVLQDSDASSFLRLLLLLQNGVHAMSQTAEGLVETSGNLGVAAVCREALSAAYFPRSSVDAALEDLRVVSTVLADACGFKAAFGAQSPGWPASADSKLASVAAEVFAEQNGKPMVIESIHAGLECSWFYKKNPALDMISIGPTIYDIHSPQERVDLDTLAPHTKLIAEIVRRLHKAH